MTPTPWKYGKSECPRKIYSGRMTQFGWERRSNHELRDLFDEPSIVALVKAQRLKLLGHVYRMSDQRTPKRIL